MPQLKKPGSLRGEMTPLKRELMRLRKRDWLSSIEGSLWPDENEADLEKSFKKERRQRQRQGRIDDRHRQGREDHRTTSNYRRQRTDGYRGRAHNVSAMMSYEETAFATATESKLGKLGGFKERKACRGRPAVPVTDPSSRMKCTHCGALLFEGEAKSSQKGIFDTIWNGGQLCCATGKVQLRPVKRNSMIEDCWLRFEKLLRTRARALNNSLAMASMPAKTPSLPGSSSFRPCVSIQGKLHHKVGSLALPTSDGIPASFAQLYVHDPSYGDVNATRINGQGFSKLSLSERASIKALLDELHRILVENNPYVRDIKTAAEIFREHGTDLIDAVFAIDNSTRTTDERTYSTNRQAHTFSEVKVYHNEAKEGHAIELRFRDGAHYETHECNRAYDPLHFVLLFPEGDDGWQPYVPHSKPRFEVEEGTDDEEEEEGNMLCEDENERENVESLSQITPREYYAHRLQVREFETEEGDSKIDDVLTRWGRLYQEYCCMALAKAEAQKLRFVSNNQKLLRAEVYKGLRDAVHAHDAARDGTVLQVGKKVILPASFTGGPRDQSRRYHDAMAVVRRLGKPSFFITMTCNPQWEEIVKNVPPGESVHDRPDLVARVFKLKLQALTDELYKDGIFGKMIARLHVIEFQHRGLPHAHILLVTKQRLKCAEDVDACISAELPVEPKPPKKPDVHANTDTWNFYDRSLSEYRKKHQRWKTLNDLVVKHMIHGPCGLANSRAPCMRDGCCSKRYGKPFSKETIVSDGNHIYPTYRRRGPNDGGATYMHEGRLLTNEWVVPYSPYLLLKYGCHINVEACLSVRGVKYLYKYVFKGPDRSMVGLHTNANGELDEVGLYQDMRSMGAAESCWRTFNFSMYDRFPPVHAVPLHLPDEQNVTFEPGEERARIDVGAPKTELTEWFTCVRNMTRDERKEVRDEFGNVTWSAKYCDWPEQYTYKSKKWTRKKKKTQTVGRVHNAHPKEGERFYLRMLLHVVTATDVALEDCTDKSDAFTFEAIKYANGIKYETFKAAARARNMLQDDEEWHQALSDASRSLSASQVRSLYIFIVMHSEPEEPATLFEEFWEEMADDFRHKLIEGNVEFNSIELRARLLLFIEDMLASGGYALEDMNLELSSEDREAGNRLIGETEIVSEVREVRDEMIAPSKIPALLARAVEMEKLLLPEQRLFYEEVVRAVELGENATIRCFFLDAPGGTGKTFTFNAILVRVRSRNKIALAVASSGIAAILLEMGRTFHGRFKASREPAEGQQLGIKAQTNLAKLLRRAELIIWDEAAMGNKFSLEALDLTLRDFMGSKLPFGGKVVVLGGDYRQTLPIVKGGSRSQTLRIAISQSYLWKEFKQHRLTKNMRIEKMRETLDDGGPYMRALLEQLSNFGSWLLRLGEGKLEIDEEENIEIPSEMCLDEGCDLDALVEWVYPNLASNCQDETWLSTRAILAPLHVDVNATNQYLTDSFPGTSWILDSADVISPETPSIARVGVEVLNTFNGPGIPLHRIELKRNMPVMLMRNLRPEEGLCNGTRLLVQNVIGKTVVVAKIVTGTHASNIVAIPRCSLSPEDSEYPFKWSRRQFPIRIAFCMTINKAQGQTLSRVGIYLLNKCFAHGQLYVAASRVGHPDHIRFALHRSADGSYRTANIVYKEVLT